MLPSHRPASSATLSRAVPSSFRQHRSRLRRLNTSCTGGNLLLPLRLQPLSLLVAVGTHRAASWSWSETGCPARPGPRQTWRQAQVQEMEGTALREMVTAPLPPPEEGPVGESFVLICFCSAAGPAASGTQNINKRAVSSVSGSQEEESGVPCITGSLPMSYAGYTQDNRADFGQISPLPTILMSRLSWWI